MEKYIEINLGNQIDRYHIIDISTDEFIDTFLIELPEKVKDISESDYTVNRKYAMKYNIDDKYTVEHYTFKYPSKEIEKEWITFVRQHRKYMNKLDEN